MSDYAQRLGKNHGAYFGETIDIATVLDDCVAASRAHGWSIEEILAPPKPRLLAFTRAASRNTEHETCNTQPSSRFTFHVSPESFRDSRLYLSTGIHGDEPAGPLAVRQLLQENQWPPALEIWLFPCLNPTGFTLKRRENAHGIDLNREYLQPKAEETIAHIAWLNRQPKFDVCLCLHEDWESHGFYVYELNPDNQRSLAEPIVEHVAKVCPIDGSEIIEGRPAKNGIIRPSLDPRTRPQWPESFYLLTHKTRLSYTLEAPSDFPLAVRVAALVAAVRAALEAFRRTRG